jgi:hypothetical protein
MDVKASSVIRVIISGEWIWVEPGTFTVQDFIFVDDRGDEINRAGELAYHFISTNGDPYYGPLSAITLIKLRSPELDATQHEAPTGQELPQGGSTSERDDAREAEDAASKSAAAGLFSDPVPMPAGEPTEHKGLL